MQKSKKKKWLFVFLILFFGITRVNAECDNAKIVELSKQANNIQTNYEVKEEEFPLANENESESGEDSYVLNFVYLNVYNITQDIYVKIYDKESEYNEEIHFDDTDNGTYTLKIENVNKIKNFSIDVYSEDPCTVDLLRKVSITTPMHNELHDLSACEGSEAYYCEEWTTVEVNETPESVVQKEMKNGSREEVEEPGQSFWEKNKGIIIGVGIFALIAMAIGVGFTMIKRKRSRAI